MTIRTPAEIEDAMIRLISQHMGTLSKFDPEQFKVDFGLLVDELDVVLTAQKQGPLTKSRYRRIAAMKQMEEGK